MPTHQMPPEQAIAKLVALGARNKPVSRHATLLHLCEALGMPLPANGYDDATRSTIKKNYLWVCRMVHPDKCKLPRAVEAFRAVDDAYKNYQASGPL